MVLMHYVPCYTLLPTRWKQFTTPLNRTGAESDRIKLHRWCMNCAADSTMPVNFRSSAWALDEPGTHLGRRIGEVGGKKHIKHKSAVRIRGVWPSQNEHTGDIGALGCHGNMH